MNNPPTCPIEPLADRIVIRRLDGAKVTPGGIILPDHPKARERRKVHEGVVAAVGQGRRRDDGTYTPPAVGVGDRIVFTTLLGTEELFEDGVTWTIISEVDVLAVVQEG